MTKEERLQTFQDNWKLYENISCGVVLFRFYQDDRIVVDKMNSEAERILACTKQELIEAKTLRLEEILDEDDRERIKEYKELCANPGDRTSFECHCRHRDGTSVWVDGVVENLGYDREEQVANIWMQATFLDMTARKTEEQQLYNMLQQEQQQYREAILYNCMYTFTFDLTEGYVTQDYDMTNGDRPAQIMGLTLPVHYDEIIRRFNEIVNPIFLEGEERGELTVAKLLEKYEHGERMYEFNFFDSRLKSYQRMTILMSENRENGHVMACVIGKDITKQYKERDCAMESLAVANRSLQRQMSIIQSYGDVYDATFHIDLIMLMIVSGR